MSKTDNWSMLAQLMEINLNWQKHWFKSQIRYKTSSYAIAYDSLGPDTPWDKLTEAAAAECGKMEAALRAVSIVNEPNLAKINWKC